MEIALEGGRYKTADFGGLETVTGTKELAQRLLMKLTARRGGFALWPEYGSRLYTLAGAVRPSERLTAARQFITEALADESDVEISGLEITDGGEGTLCISLTLTLPAGTLGIDFTI
ncbi:MAG: hypothetical protein EOM54_04190 [Clostridia bacterium]|nr:hypothetical protein [Clostridia bacterium]